MTSRDRVLTSLKRSGNPDHIPFSLFLGGVTRRMMAVYQKETGSNKIPEEYFDFDTRMLFPAPTGKKTDFSRYFQTLEDRIFFNEWGVGAVQTLYDIPDHKYHPLAEMKTVDEINAFDWPDLDAPYRYGDAAEKTKEYQQRGYAVCGSMGQTIFETAWLMRGMEQFLMDFYINEKIARAICENITRIRIRQAEHYARAGVDVLMLGDDIVTQQGCMISPETYRTFIKPCVQQVASAAKAVNPEIIIFMHSCGKIEPMIDDLIEVGVEVLHPVQPECNDLRKIKEVYGNRLSFWGGIGIQSVLSQGSPEEVVQTVKDTASLMGEGGGFLVCPAHLLDPSVSWENVMAFIDTARGL